MIKIYNMREEKVRWGGGREGQDAIGWQLGGQVPAHACSSQDGLHLSAPCTWLSFHARVTCTQHVHLLV